MRCELAEMCSFCITTSLTSVRHVNCPSGYATAEPTEEEPKQVQQKKNNERGEGSVVPKTGNQINAPFMVTWSRTRVATETSQEFQAPESQGHRRRGSKRYEYCIRKTRTYVGLMVQCD